MATVIVFPALLLSFWLVLQYAVAAHVRNVAQTAAQDAAIAMASGGDPAVAYELVDRSAGALTSNVTVRPSRSTDEVSVVVSVDVLQVFPIGSFDVTVTARAPVERFIPQPERP